jgi:hypothetical protein
MPTVEIDFDVFKELTVRRLAESDSYNDVIRRLLDLKPIAPTGKPKAVNGKAWVAKGVSFPDGTLLRAPYKGQLYHAHIKNGRLMVNDGAASSSLSHAARLITNTSVDGWTFWEVKRPTDIEWKKAGDLRAPPAA